MEVSVVVAVVIGDQGGKRAMGVRAVLAVEAGKMRSSQRGNKEVSRKKIRGYSTADLRANGRARISHSLPRCAARGTPWAAFWNPRNCTQGTRENLAPCHEGFHSLSALGSWASSSLWNVNRLLII
jgi:hypothetical protein